MRKFSTLVDLIFADISEDNARSKKSRNQRQDITFRTLLKQSMRSKKEWRYRRDRVLIRLCKLNMNKILKCTVIKSRLDASYRKCVIPFYYASGLDYWKGYFRLDYRDWETDRKSTRLNSSHSAKSRMPSSA